MRQNRREHYITCPVQAALDTIGGKWKPVLLALLSENTMRFGELQRRLPNVTQRMLTNQLRELERDGLIARKVYAQVPPKVEYSLTELGNTLAPMLEELRKWGERYMLPRHLKEAEEAASRQGSAVS